MLIRIVKLGFKPEEVNNFKAMFDRTKEKIRGFEGCNFLELYQDKDDETIFFTYSYWENEAALDNYRNSSFFKEVWQETKQMFNAKPEAWSVDKIWSGA